MREGKESVLFLQSSLEISIFRDTLSLAYKAVYCAKTLEVPFVQEGLIVQELEKSRELFPSSNSKIVADTSVHT